MHLVLINTTLSKLITSFSWMLLHSLWQGLLLAIITGIVLVVFAKRSSAACRYNMALALFVLFILTSGLTFIYEWQSIAGAVLKPGSGTIAVNSPPLFFNVHRVKQLVKIFTDYFSANAPFAMLIWFMVFLFRSVKMVSCLTYNQRIRNYQVYQPSESWMNKINLFVGRLGITRQVKLLQSGYIKVPVVIGHLKPVILIPAGLMAGLPPEQVEAILLHELAHIKRNDYFVNFLQHIAEAIFFFNPGLLWISSLLREERENCCDDIALAQTNNKMELVQALISFKEHELYGQAYATAFPGKKNYLMHRVVRILHNKDKGFGRGEKLFFIVSILLFGLIVTTAAVAHINEYTGTLTSQRTAVDKITAMAVNHTNVPMAKKQAFKKSTVGQFKHKMMNGIAGINRHAPVKAPVDLKTGADRQPDTADVTFFASIKRQANESRMQAERDRKQADVSRAQNDLDRKAAAQSRLQALKDQEQARLDRLQADKDRAQAYKDRAQAEMDRAQADKDRQQFAKDKIRTEQQRGQSDKSKVSVGN